MLQNAQHLLSIFFSIHSTHLQRAGGLPALEGFAICPGIPLEVIVLIQYQRLPLTHKCEHAAISPQKGKSARQHNNNAAFFVDQSQKNSHCYTIKFHIFNPF
jgi:hypothetical protein